MAEASHVQLSRCDCHWTLLIISQNEFMKWLGVVRPLPEPVLIQFYAPHTVTGQQSFLKSSKWDGHLALRINSPYWFLLAQQLIFISLKPAFIGFDSDVFLIQD